MKNVIVRSLSGLVYIGLIIAAILLGWPYFMGLMALFGILAIFEISAISAHITGTATDEAVLFPYSVILDAICVAALIGLPAMLGGHGLALFTYISVLVITLYLPLRISLGLYEKPEEPLRTRFATIAMSVMGVFYVGIPLSALTYLYMLLPGVGKSFVLCIFILIWLNDTGAFCFGSTLGKRRLWEKLSPKKSWEGFWGGMICCILFGVMCFFFFDFNNFPLWAWIVLGILVCVFSTWGDLFESLLKRVAGMKDSSHLIPGHGGILDRIDSLLLVAPIASAFIIIFS